MVTQEEASELLFTAIAHKMLKHSAEVMVDDDEIEKYLSLCTKLDEVLKHHSIAVCMMALSMMLTTGSRKYLSEAKEFIPFTASKN